MNPAGEQHPQRVALGVLGRVEELGEDGDLRFPQRKTAPRPDMTAALRPLEGELTDADIQELPQHAGRGHVQERVDTGLFQRGRLRGPAARDDRAGRLEFPDDLQLCGPGALRSEAEHAHTPGPAVQCGTRLLQQGARLLRAGECQRQEGQRPVLGDRRGEPRLVTDPGHRPLREGQLGTQGPAHRRPAAQRVERHVIPYRVAHGSGDRADRPTRIAPLLREAGGQEAVLSDGKQLRPQIAGTDHAGHFTWVVRNRRRVRPPAPQHPVPARHDRLRTVQDPHGRSDVLREAALLQQGELRIQNNSGRTSDHGGRGGVRPDTAAGPDRQVQRRVRHQLLEEHKGAQLADPPATFTAAGDQSVRTAPGRLQRLRMARDLDEHPVVADDVGQPQRRLHAEHHRVHAPATHQLGRADGTPGGHPHPERLRHPLPDRLQRLPGPPVPLAEVEHAKPTGPADGGDDSRIGFPERADPQDSIRQACGCHRNSGKS